MKRKLWMFTCVQDAPVDALESYTLLLGVHNSNKNALGRPNNRRPYTAEWSQAYSLTGFSQLMNALVSAVNHSLYATSYIRKLIILLKTSVRSLPFLRPFLPSISSFLSLHLSLPFLYSLPAPTDRDLGQHLSSAFKLPRWYWRSQAAKEHFATYCAEELLLLRAILVHVHEWPTVQH